MITKVVLQQVTFKIITSPFELMECRVRNNIQQLPKCQSPLIQYADQITLREGGRVLWNGCQIQILRALIWLNLNQIQRKRQSRIDRSGFGSKIISCIKYAINSGLYLVQVILRTDKQNYFHNNPIEAINYIIQHNSISNILLSLSFHVLSDILKNKIGRYIGQRIGGPIIRNRAARQLRNYLIKIFIFFLTYPLITLSNRVLLNNLSLIDAINQKDFYGGWQILMKKMALQILINQTFRSTIKIR